MHRNEKEYAVILIAYIGASINVTASSEDDDEAQVRKMFEDNDIEMMDGIRYDFGLEGEEILDVYQN